MAAVTGCISTQVNPNTGVKIIMITTPPTADSGDTIDIGNKTVTGGETLAAIFGVIAVFDADSADAVTGTWSGTTVTIDAAGGTTDHTYRIIVCGY